MEKNRENMTLMIEEIISQLKVVNAGAIRPEDYSLDRFEDVQEIHTMVMKKPSFSVSEMDAIVTELGSMRDKK
ncbi:DUF1128 domain-containing protein [Evansella halocellulosilytica]|uniref:DUF1128 domain-containing protein n=1 Tax=Evansella halocellulosilytica TaxID=2011013 RepID=UPI000BB6B3E5|nr:DUF1128 domain-containing protein [Evansella halocellulosilytica]